MDDAEVLNHMMDLCMQLGAMPLHDKARNEEETLLYEQLCRTLTKQTKLQEMMLDAGIEEIKGKIERENSTDEP